MSTPVAGPSHIPHPPPATGQGQGPIPYDQNQKRRQDTDDTRRAYVDMSCLVAKEETDDM
jgi:hypothetical protein